MTTGVDALIMAAGRGSRLGPETIDRPKSLVDLGGTTPLELQLELLARRGVRRVHVVTGYRRHLIESTVRECAAGRFEVIPVWNPFWPVTNVLGSAWMARLHLDRAFVYLHADTVFDQTILDDLLSIGAEAALPVDVRECEPEQMKATVASGVVRNLSKDLPPEETTGEFIGIGFFSGAAVVAIRDGMDAVMEEGNMTAYFEEAVNWAIRNRGLAPRVVETAGRPWTEIDFPEDLALARELLPRLLP
jgi:choline kinase